MDILQWHVLKDVQRTHNLVQPRPADDICRIGSVLSLWAGALQSADDLRRMLKCMAANGFLSQEMAVKIVPMEPYEYLQTAELNQRSVGFIPANTQVCACTDFIRIMTRP